MKTLARLFTNFKNSISRHIIAYFFLFGIIPLALVSFIFFSIYYQAQKDHIIRVQQEIAERLVQGTTSQLHNSIEQCKGLTQVLNLSVQGSRNIQSLLNNFLDHRPEYSLICLKNLDGREINKASRYYTFRFSELGTVVRDEPFAQALRGNITISSVGTSDFSMSPYVRITLPITNLDETIIGVLEADVAVTSLWHLVSRESIGENRYAYVVDSNGRLIAYRDLSQVLQNRDLLSIQSVRNFTADRTGTFEYQGIHGVQVIGASASVSLTGWGIIVEEPVRTAFQRLYLLSAVFIGIFLITLILAVFLGLRFSYKNIVEPIRHIQKDAEYIAQGRFDNIIDTKRTDELGQLSDSFNRMIKTLKATTVSRDRLIREIEEKIRIEESLRESEERYRLVFHQSPAGLFNYDRNLVITACNERFADILETTDTRLIGLDLTTLDDQGVLPAIRQPLQGQLGFFEGFYSATTSNAKKWVFMRNAPLYDGKKNIRGGVGIVEDITERRTWEQTLSDSERKYRLLAENMKDLLTMWNMDLQPLYVSPSIRDILGYSESEFLELFRGVNDRNTVKAFNRFITATSLNTLARIVKDRLGGDDREPPSPQGQTPFELEFIRKDGTTVWTETMTGFLRDADGRRTGVVAITRNITKRREAEQALRLSEQRYTQLMEHAKDIIYETDAEGYIRHFSAAALEITEYSEKDLRGKHYLSLIRDDYCHVVERFYGTQFVKKIRNTYNEWPVLTKSGATRWLGQNVQLIFKDEVVAGFQVVSRDITERKYLEDALRKREEQLRILTDNISDVLWSIDLDTMRFNYVNPSIEGMTGFTTKEFIDKDPESLFPQETYREILHILDEELKLDECGISEKERTRELEWEQYHKDGHMINVAAAVSFLRNEQGKPQGIIGISRDISERKKAQEALRKSEEKYRTILETMEEGYYEVDLRGDFTFLNDSMCRILGVRREDAMGKGHQRFVDRENARKVLGTFNRVFTSGIPEKVFDWELTTGDHHKRYVAASVALRRNSDGKPAGFRGVVRDITQRKKAENALSESEKKYRSILENMEDIYCEMDLQGKCTFVNTSGCRFSGYSREELLSMHLRDLTVPEQVDRLSEYTWEIYKTGLPGKPYSWEILKKNGELAISEVIVTLIRDNNGKPVGFRGLGRDISERMKAEKALRNSEKKYRELVENMNDIFYIADTEGRLTYISPVVEQVFGYGADDVIGQLITDFMPREDATLVRQRFRGILSGSLKPYDYRLLKKDGTTLWARTFAQPVYDGEHRNRVIGIQGIITDITDRKNAEEALQAHREHLELINKILRHDLINDLAMMKSALDLYMDTPEEELLTEASSRISKSIGLIRRMRELESFFSAHHDTRLYDIADVVKNLIGNYPLIDIGIEGRGMVIADESLESVIDNIITNAMAHGKADRIEITINNDADDFCTVRIADNGTGISADIREIIFEEGFSRGDRAHTGLGLHIVKKAMESYGGRVHVEDNEPRGAAFILRFRKL